MPTNLDWLQAVLKDDAPVMGNPELRDSSRSLVGRSNAARRIATQRSPTWQPVGRGIGGGTGIPRPQRGRTRWRPSPGSVAFASCSSQIGRSERCRTAFPTRLPRSSRVVLTLRITSNGHAQEFADSTDLVAVGHSLKVDRLITGTLLKADETCGSRCSSWTLPTGASSGRKPVSTRLTVFSNCRIAFAMRSRESFRSKHPQRKTNRQAEKILALTATDVLPYRAAIDLPPETGFGARIRRAMSPLRAVEGIRHLQGTRPGSSSRQTPTPAHQNPQSTWPRLRAPTGAGSPADHRAARARPRGGSFARADRAGAGSRREKVDCSPSVAPETHHGCPVARAKASTVGCTVTRIDDGRRQPRSLRRSHRARDRISCTRPAR